MRTGAGYVIGVDIGGTFTDAVAVDAAGIVTIAKAPSTPPHFERGFVDALRALASRLHTTLEGLLSRTEALYHGCTVGTNALIEGRVAKVGLLTTRGHRDSVFIMQTGGRNWGMAPEYIARVAGQDKPAPLVPKQLAVEVDERVTFDGRVLVELNQDQAREAIASLVAQGVEAFAISLLWSVINPDHEIALVELVREAAPSAFVSASSQVIPRTGEYQRTVATVINSLIGPAMNVYLTDLEGELASLGYDQTLWVMSCSGGVIETSLACSLPLLTINSGPVAGLVGAGTLARASAVGMVGEDALDVITTDMGGTTFDVGVIRGGQPLSRASTRHNQFEYFVPTLDVRSVGAGGGSIIHFDQASGGLRVGPTSAGADPGPVAYRRGGTAATVTDADLVLGYLNPDYFLGGDLRLSTEAASEALARAGAPLGLNAAESAAAAVRIVDNQMADAIRVASVQQGYDPRASVMYAYGGAGPVHATAIARQLGIRRITVPLSNLAAGWSAFGAVSSDALVVDELPQVRTYPFDPQEMNDAWSRLERKSLATMEAQGISPSAVEWERTVDMRYAVQVNEVHVPAPLGRYDAATIEGLVRAFEQEYDRLFGEGAGYPDAGFVMTAIRVRAKASITELALVRDAEIRGSSMPFPIKGERQVVFYETGPTPVSTPIFDGAKITAGMTVDGPGIVEFLETTLVLREGERATVDQFGSVEIAL